MPRVITVFLVAALLASLAGCGKKGPLIPPEALVPAAITDLSVQQQGSQVSVSWTAPTRSVKGGKMERIAEFRVFRRDVLPPGQDCEGCAGQYRLVKTVDTAYLQDVARADNFFSYVEPLPADKQTRQYRVVAVDGEGAESAYSNPARLTPVSLPAPPKLGVVSAIEGIRLSWEPVRPPEGTLAGYLLYRRKASEEQTGTPIVLEPGTTSYEDQRVELGVPYRYTLRAVVELGGSRAVGDPSAEAEGKIDVPEISAPPKPQL